MPELIELPTNANNVLVCESQVVILIEDSLPELVEIGSKGAQGIQGAPGNDATGFVSGNVTVLTGQTKVIDISLDKIHTEWSVTVKDMLLNKVKFCKVSGLINDDYCVYDLKGDVIPFQMSVSGMVLSIINLHSKDLVINFSKNSISI